MPWTYTIANPSSTPQTSTRHRDRDEGASFASRAKHAPQWSITDDNHHVTETIGFLYGGSDDESRRSSVASNHRASTYSNRSTEREEAIPKSSSFHVKSVERPLPNGKGFTHTVQPPARGVRPQSFEGKEASPTSPPLPSPAETAQAQFPLNDIDYESSPAAVAQELSNLQALRRMSMSAHAAGDPDLPDLNSVIIPGPPAHDASEDDAAKLFWVPARLHPELAPKEFKTFLESKAEQIKRRSGDLSSLSTSSSMTLRHTSVGSSSSGLSRKKSMLSKEISNFSGYQDGADRLEKKRSAGQEYTSSDPDLAELEDLVVKNLTVNRPGSADDDNDFVIPVGVSAGLKRSTKTTYRRGAVRDRAKGRGDRKPASHGDDSASASSTPDTPTFAASFFHADSANLADTLGSSFAPKSLNFSRLATRSPSPPAETKHASWSADGSSPVTRERLNVDRFSTTSAPEGGNGSAVNLNSRVIPRIVEPETQEVQRAPAAQWPSRNAEAAVQAQRPARTSSRETPTTIRTVPPTRPQMARNYSSAQGIPKAEARAESPANMPPDVRPKQSLEQASPLLGIDTNTSNLAFIPTLPPDNKSMEKKEPKKSSWGWLRGRDEDKHKEKAGKYDHTRLDVLQSSIDGPSRRRETIEIDRTSLQLDEERKRESQKKSMLGSGVGEKKEREGLFSSLFSGKKVRAEKEKKYTRGLSPEPPYRELVADKDYSWTRFSILEERAIYRMAHIKLANPRRPLYSQVLLSNFMYSYLAKVQQMHPQMNLPTSAKQQKKQKEQQQQKDQLEEFTQYQRYQEVGVSGLNSVMVC